MSYKQYVEEGVTIDVALTSYKDVERQLMLCSSKEHVEKLNEEVDICFMHGEMEMSDHNWSEFTSAMKQKLRDIEKENCDEQCLQN